MEYRDRGRFLVPVADTDSEYVREREQKKAAACREVQIFGAEFFDEKGAYTGKPLDTIPGVFQKIWDKNKILGFRAIEVFAQEQLFEQDIRNHPAVQHIVRNMPNAAFAGKELLRAIVTGEVPDEVMIEMLRRHRRIQEINARRIQEQVPELQKRFLGRLMRLLQSPSHPLTSDMLSEDTIIRRIHEVVVVAQDRLVYMQEREGGLAEYNHAENSIFFIPNVQSSVADKKEVLDDMYGHEMLHVVSGRTIIRSKTGYDIQKIGLRMGDGFNWINEAVTETLTNDLHEQRTSKDTGVYVVERVIYRALTKRVPATLFLRAYFENATPLQDPYRLPAQQQLFHAVVDAYGFNILVHIERLLQEGRAVEVIKGFDEQGNWLDKK